MLLTLAQITNTECPTGVQYVEVHPIWLVASVNYWYSASHVAYRTRSPDEGQRVVVLEDQRVVVSEGQRLVVSEGQRVVVLEGQRVVLLEGQR